MSLKKFRWSQVYESSEEELITLLQTRNIDAVRVHAEAGSGQTGQRSECTITIWCAEGSFAVKVGSGNISLQTGDALRIAASTMYSVQPGIAGCAYYLTS